MTQYCDYEYELKLSYNQPISPVILNNTWRVKLFYLNGEGQWDDQGTGHIQITQIVIILLIAGKTNLFKNDI